MDEDEFRIGLNLYLDSDGNIYIVGSTQTKTGWRHESIILKYAADGSFLWEQLHDESINDIRAGENHLYFVGVLEDYGQDGIFDDDVSITHTGKYGNAFILKSDLNGDFLWGVAGEHDLNYSDSYGERVDIDDEENIFMTGHFRDELKFGDITLTDYTNNGYVVKCDSSGQFIWLETIVIR